MRLTEDPPLHHWYSKLLLLCIFLMAWLAMKLSLPALPAIGAQFKADQSLLKSVVFLFFVCFSLSQLVWAVFAEHMGGRLIIIAGLVVTLLGNSVIIFSQSMPYYIVGRCVEGVGAGALSVCGRGMIGTYFNKKQTAHLLGIVSSFTALMPALAPILGAYILTHYGWRYIFVAYTPFLLLFIILSYSGLPSLSKTAREKRSVVSYIQGYFDILSDKVFWHYMPCYAIYSGLMLGYYGAMPFWFVVQWKMSEQAYTYLGIFSVGAYIAGIIISRLLMQRLKSDHVVLIGLIEGFLCALTASLFAIFHFDGVLPLVIVMTIFSNAAGVIFPVVYASILHYFSKLTTLAAALNGICMFFMAGFFAWICSHINVEHLVHLAILLSTVSVLTLLVFNSVGGDGVGSDADVSG